MKKYIVCVSDYSHYMPKEIIAEDESEAEEKYMEMVVNGYVEIVDSGYGEVEVNKIK